MAITPFFKKSLTHSENRPATLWVNVAASQTIKTGDLVKISSGLLAAAAAADTTIIGLADADITTGASPVAGTDWIPVTLASDAIITLNYTGSTKTSLSNADMFGTKFDLSDKVTINLDDTTGGMCIVVGYDNTKKTADVVIASGNRVF